MDERQAKAVKTYQDRLKDQKNLAVTVGRPESAEGSEEKIWLDISQKLRFEPKQTFLDIGCGYGNLTRFALETSKRYQLQSTFLDISEAIDRLEQDDSFDTSAIKLSKGIFPYSLETPEDCASENFDRVLVYSVLHYTDEPLNFILEATKLLKKRGRLLIGDLPNVHKKGRFLSSPFGREFEASYQGCSIDQVPKFKNAEEYIKSSPKQNLKICDDLLLETMEKLRSKDFEVLILDQPPELPFSHTREDLLITRN